MLKISQYLISYGVGVRNGVRQVVIFSRFNHTAGELFMIVALCSKQCICKQLKSNDCALVKQHILFGVSVDL